MRKLLFLALILASISTFSQSPQKINYQAVARDASGNVVTSLIGIKFEILQGSVSGTLVYDETNTSMPSTAGIFTTHIGSGTPGTGTFSSINWANGPYFIRVSIDPLGGTSYNVVGTSELVSVPYALYAETAGNAQTFTAGNGITINSGTITNSLPNQTVNISGSSVTGSYPNYTITAPAPTASTGISISGGTITNTAPDQTVTISGATGTYPNFTITPTAPTTITPGNSNITVSGSDPSFTISSVPQLTVVGNQLSISNGNTVTLPTGTTYTNGSGIAFTSGTVITNTAPDQTVNIANGTNVTVNSAYPNFTINATPTLSLAANVLSISGGNSVTLPTPPTPTAGTGISIVSGTITNTAPNQTVNISGGGVSGTYPNYTITSAPATTVTAGNNMNVAGTAPSYTVSTPTYSLNFPNSSVVNVTNGINTSTASIPQPTLTLSGVNSNVISAGSNSITVATYTAGSGMIINGAFPSYTLSASSTGTNTSWNTLGNSGTVDGINFIGTTSNIPFNVRVNNQKAGRIDHLLGNAFWGYQTGNANTTGTFNVAVGNQALFSNTAGSQNSALGTNALYFNSTGNYNTASGYQSMYSNTSGFQNTSAGVQSLYSNTTGNDNNAFGYQSLRANTTGVRNVAVGNYALFSNVAGSQNTAIGQGALFSQSYNPGSAWNSDNVAVGLQALYNNQPTSTTNSGTKNTAMGNFGLQNNTTGYDNAALGTNALLNNTTGYYNTATGSDALRNNTTGYTNTGNGNQALYWNNGIYNTGVGHGVFQNNNAGNYNTGIGSLAGYNSTGSSNVFIGYQAGYSEAGSNKLYIANNAGTPLIYGDFSSGNVGIGTTAPSSRFHVKSNGSGYIVHENTLGGTNPFGIMFTSPSQSWFIMQGPGTGPADAFAIFDGTSSAMRMVIMPSSGNVGIGTTAPSSLFHVNGQVTITDGTQGFGKVLTSNATGTSSWNYPLTPTKEGNYGSFFYLANSTNYTYNTASTILTFTPATNGTVVFNVSMNYNFDYSLPSQVFCGIYVNTTGVAPGISTPFTEQVRVGRASGTAGAAYGDIPVSFGYSMSVVAGNTYYVWIGGKGVNLNQTTASIGTSKVIVTLHQTSGL